MTTDLRDRRFRLVVAFVALVSLATPSLAAEAPSAAGHWEGAIDIPGLRLGIDVDLVEGEGGALSGDISIPMQGAKNLPLAHIAASGGSVTFQIVGPPGEPTFRGTLTADGAKLEGTFTQGGQSFPFVLERKASPAETAKGTLESLDGFVSKALVDWEVPGLAIVVVRDGKVVYSKGFGKRSMKDDLPVTPQTLFAIGSCTKAFTTFVMGTLVDEGKLDWDRPVRDYLPEFKLRDASASERITPRDLVTHRSGLPRHDAVWYNATDLSRKELVARLAFLEANADLRAKWQYNNLMFLSAGYLVERITGESWENAVRKRILAPLGMSASNFSVADSQKAVDFALPYEERGDKVVEVPFRTITNMGPAGSINSSVEDLSRWLIALLSDGKAGGKQVIRKETLAEILEPQSATGQPQERPEISAPEYAMGWGVATYRGHTRIQHGGGIDGFSALVTLAPHDGIGIAVLANLSGTGLPGVLTNHVLDRILGLSEIDWNVEALGKRALAKAAGKEAEKKKEVVRKPGTRPSHPLAEYAGDYEDPGYGAAKVALTGERLELTYNGMTCPLEHWHYDVWNVAKCGTEPVLEDTKLLFRSNVKGNIDGFSAVLEPLAGEIVFHKRPDAKLADPTYLGRFLGDYELAGQTISVGLQGRVLTLSVPGQPLHELVPDQDDEFTLRGLSGFSVKFLSDASGSVTELESRQPNGVFAAKKKAKP